MGLVLIAATVGDFVRRQLLSNRREFMGTSSVGQSGWLYVRLSRCIFEAHAAPWEISFRKGRADVGGVRRAAWSGKD